MASRARRSVSLLRRLADVKVDECTRKKKKRRRRRSTRIEYGGVREEAMRETGVCY